MAFSPYTSAIRMVCLLCLCVVLVGCGGNKRVTKVNFDRIKEGMPRADVEAILGQADSDESLDLHEGSGVAAAGGITTGVSARPAGGPKWVKWGDDKKWIKVGFVGDKVGKGMIQQQGL